MRDKVFEHLYSRYPRLTLVGDTGFTTNTHYHLVMMHTVDQVTQGFGEDLGISIHLEWSCQINKILIPNYRPSNRLQRNRELHPLGHGFCGRGRNQEGSSGHYM